MAFRSVGRASFTYVKYSECSKGQVLAEGYYAGAKQGRYGLQHQVQAPSNTAVVLNSSGHLNWLLENHVTVGDYIRVIYDGSDVLDKGKFKGKEAHRFLLDIDDEKKKDAKTITILEPSEVSDDEQENSFKATRRAVQEDINEEVGFDDEVEEEIVPVKASAKAEVKAEATPKKMSAEDILAKYRKK